MDPQNLHALFLTEGRELLARADAELFVLERAPATPSAIDAAFRSLHSLKGMCATVGLHDATAALHAGETLLAGARDAGAIGVDAISALLALCGALRSTLDDEEAHRAPSVALAPLAASLTALAAQPAPVPADAGAHGAARAIRAATAAADASWRVDVQLASAAAIPSARATVIIRRLAALAPVLRTAPDDAARQDDAWDGAFTVWLGSGTDPEVIERAVRAAGEVAECHVAREVVASAAAAGELAATRTVRIPAQRLDDLLDLVGELVIARDRLLRVAMPDAAEPVRQALDDTSRLVMQLRDAILTSRLVPLSQVLDRFPRHVRDLALTLGKDVELVVEGRELEVDRSLLDELGEPLLHLLRNAIDHGLETAAARVAAGKPARGRLVVRAARDGAMVALTVADDGAGVDRARVAAAAAAQGVADATRLVQDDATLLQLLARPGLSTAGTITTLSGRGVGLDAVLARVQSLGGRLDLTTAAGTGTAITLRLPLSVAMLRALLVRVAAEVYAIPLTLVHATHCAADVRVAGAAGGIAGGAAEVEVDGERCRLVSLRSHLGLPPANDVSGHLVVLEAATGRLALRVDACTSQQEIVVKPMPRVRGAATLFSGGTILPDGTPSLILDINSLP